jgi:hypothetical protein
MVIGVLIKDLFRLYTNELPGKSTVLSDLQFQYIDLLSTKTRNMTGEIRPQKGILVENTWW